MITCPRCHHQNREHLSACELCNASLAYDETPSPPEGDEEMLAFEDFGAVSYDVDESLEPTSNLRGELEEIQFEVEGPDLFALGEESDGGARGTGRSHAPSVDGAPSGLARLLHDALAAPSNASPRPSAQAASRVSTENLKVPKVSNISDQELSDFLLDALSDTDAPPSIDAPIPKANPAEEAGLFKMPSRIGLRDSGRALTMEVPGASALLLKPEPTPVVQSTEPSTRAVGLQCSNCGGYNPEGMFYCVYCGFSLETSQDEEAPVSETSDPSIDEEICPSCNTSNPTGNRFCGSCGFKLSGGLAKQETVEADPRVVSSAVRALEASRKASPWDVRLISINEDGSDGLEIPLDFVKTVVGRTGDTRFPTDAFLSPKHASLTIEHGELFIEDLYSLNGTFVKLRDEVPLSPGDVFLMGRQVLRFEKFEQTITPKARSSDGTRYMGSPPPGGQFKLLQIGIGGVIQNVYCIPDSGAVLGREKGDIIFPRDKFMSGRHAQIYPREDGTNCLVDLNSSNGTWIKIWEKTGLRDGDFIFMGQQLFRIEVNGLVNPRR